MSLFTVFIIIFAAIMLIIGLLWLISWLTGTRQENNPDMDVIKPAENISETKPKSKSSVVPQPVAPRESDDLTVIEGIGPKIAGMLNENGITAFAQLAEVKVIILEAMLKEANLQISNPGTWPEQAVLASEGKWDELQKLQGELKGGRLVA